MSQRRPLTKQEVLAAQKIKRAFNEKKNSLGLTQESAAEKLGWTQGGLGQYLNAKIPLNVEALLKICNLIQTNPSNIYPEITKGIGVNEDNALLERFTLKLTHLTEAEKNDLENYIDFIISKRGK